MGSSLFPDYTMEKNAYMKLKFWQIFKATKKSTGEKVSVFLFEKKIIDKKTEKEKNIILQLLKKEPEILLKYKNHKNILKIIEPLAEDSYSIGFITEYVNYNLKEWIKEYKPTKFEIKYIIYQIMTGIILLHNDYQLSHNNLNIENIFLNDNFFVKISGLNLTTTLIKDSNSINNNNNNLTQTQLELYCDLKYCSPELILSNDININSDNFCIGLIFYFLLKNDDLYFLMNNNFESYKSTYENTNIEKKIRKFNDDNTEDFLMNLLNTNHEKRKNLLLLQNTKFFKESDDNNKLISLCLLSKMESVELSKNYELLKQLPNLFNFYSSKEKEFFILPNLLYYIKKEKLINPIIPSLFLLCEQKNSKINFSEKVWPHFKFLFNMKKLPAAALYLILKKISFFSENLEKTDFNKYCIPLICKALDCGVQKIQEVILDELPKILNELDKNEFKDNIYNKLINIVIQTKNTKLKTTILNFLNHLCDYFDSYFINNNFLDDIDKIVKNETTLYICKNALILYEKLESKVNNKSFRSKIIPNLLLMMCNGEISEEMFNKGDKIIKNFISKIKEQRKEQFVQEVVDININENNSDEIKENNTNTVSEEEKKNKSKNNKNSVKNEIGINSPLSLSGTKSFLNGNISLPEYNSSDDSNLDSKEKKSKNNNNKIIKKQKNQTKDKKLEFNNNNNYNNIHNDNLLDTLLFDEKNENEESLDSGILDENRNKNNILKYVDKKEFLSSLELKQVEAKKNQKDKNDDNIISNIIKDKKNEKENSEEKKENKKSNVNLWEEIESDDENNNKNETINKFIKKKKKSGSIKEKNKEKENKTEKNEKVNDKISSNKKWDEDEDEEEGNNNNKDNIQKNEEKFINENMNNIENKDNNNIDKKNVVHKKIKKKKKKKKETKKEFTLEEKINKVEIDEKEKQKEIENNKSTTKINMEKRAANINLESLLDD